MQRANSLEKTLMLGKTESKRKKGQQRKRWLNSINDSMDMNLSDLQEVLEDSRAWFAAVHGVAKSWTPLSTIQFSSVAQSYPTLCDPMNCSTPGLPVHHQLLELAKTHVHQVGDAILPSHPLSPPFPLAFNLSQHQGLFQ